MPPLRNLWKYYPERKGFCTGIVLAFFGLSAVFFNFISNKIINPDQEESDQETQFYSEQIGKNVPIYFLYCFIITISVGFFSVFLVFNYDNEIKEEVIIKYFP